jgi:hypothetical protein
MLNRRAIFTIMLAVACVTLFAVVASAANSKNIDVLTAATVGGTQLKPGSYKVEWSSPTNEPTVTFYKGKKAVATVKGKWQDLKAKQSRNAILLDGQPDGSQKVSEIRFAGMSQSLLIENGAQP